VKCFSEAAEKCDSDALGGAWFHHVHGGKQATIGTGSSFQILWNENQVILPYPPEIFVISVAKLELISFTKRFLKLAGRVKSRHG
jgi:hypothetical protein